MHERKIVTEEKALSHQVDVWKAAIDAQMHFNELLIKMRTTVISVVLGVFGSVIVALGNPHLNIHLFHWSFHLGFVIALFGIVFVLAHFVLDYFYYFKLLLGAVSFAERIDKTYENLHLFGLTQTISKSISKRHAGILLCVFYGLPLLAGVVGILAITSIYPVKGVRVCGSGIKDAVPFFYEETNLRLSPYLLQSSGPGESKKSARK